MEQAQHLPPHYVLLTSSPFASAASLSANSLSHPASIHYHYADDPPLHLMPPSTSSGTGDIVLVMDYGETEDESQPPTVSSLSKDVVVMGVRVSEAPGANNPAMPSVEGLVNGHMYVVDMVSSPSSSRRLQPSEPSDPASILAKFKQRNEHLRRALEYGIKDLSSSAVSTPEAALQPVASLLPAAPPATLSNGSPRPFKSPKF